MDFDKLNINDLDKLLDKIAEEKSALVAKAKAIMAVRNIKIAEREKVLRLDAARRAGRAFELLAKEEAQVAKAGIAQVGLKVSK